MERRKRKNGRKNDTQKLRRKEVAMAKNSKVINKEFDKKWKKKADTAYAKEGRKNKTRYAGD